MKIFFLLLMSSGFVLLATFLWSQWAVPAMKGLPLFPALRRKQLYEISDQISEAKLDLEEAKLQTELQAVKSSIESEKSKTTAPKTKTTKTKGKKQ